MEQMSTEQQETSAVCTGTAHGRLSAERLRELLHYDPETGLFTWKISRHCVHAGTLAGSLMRNGYRQIKIEQALHLAHRLAWLYVHGRWPTAVVDHINGNKDDNRIANLREANQRLNQQNRRKAQSNNQTGFLGVLVRKNRGRDTFRAVIVIDGRRKHLGTADTAEEAHEMYLEAKRRLHPGCTI